ncbi:hypothetical protein G9A89_010123 [Geosiphon pyriformis]|nr:hypothetical protein G9A89_010123 [Geosiphon pyriformis]
MAGAAAFFENIALSIGVRVSDLVSSMIAEFQAALDAYRSESILAHPDFRNQCWVKHRHISNVICHKNLDVNWVKVKGHSGVFGNEHVNALVRTAAFSDWHLPHMINEHFLRADSTTVFDNSKYFVHNIFQSINCVYWEVGFGSQVMMDSLRVDIDWSKSLLVWHPDSYLAVSFTSTCTAGL